MYFQSHVFILAFLPLTLLGWWQLNRMRKHTAARLFLFACSLFFYGYLTISFVPILLGSIVFNFTAGRAIAQATRKRRLFLVLSLVVNLGLLGYFKYSNFFIENLNVLFHSSIGFLSVLLPLGISFFTFQQIAYLVDVYRNEAPEYAILDYALYVSFFPCVVSGPIAFHHEVIPQLREAKNRKFSLEVFSEGLISFSLGLCKKVILADAFGAAADWGYASIDLLNSTTAFVVVLSYTLQLYFDFSGYTDMARGVALMLGIRLPQNFDAPYKALTISQFWKGWHMTMTRFFTRYLYIPLGGSHKGTGRTCLNILLIFLASGLWHGANWTFVVWGGLHGVAMVADRLFGKRVETIHPVLSWGLTFAYVNFCWVFFRAESIPAALSMCKAVLRFDLGALPDAFTSCFALPGVSWLGSISGVSLQRLDLFLSLAFFLIAGLICLQGRTVDRRMKETRPGAGMALLCAILLFWSLISLSGVTTFLYSNF